MSAQGWTTSLISSLPDVHCWNLLGNGVLALAAGIVAIAALIFPKSLQCASG
jgi:hypothetical protein